MRNGLILLATAAAAAAIATPAAGQRGTLEAEVTLGKINNQYICTFDRSVPGEAVRNEAAKAAGPMMGEILHTYRHTIRGFAVRLPAQPGGRSAVAELRANNPKIAACEQDQIMKAIAPPPGKGPGGGGSTGERVPWGVDRVGGAGSTSTNTAWVLDTGIDLDHPDLNVDVGRSRSFVGGDADDKNGHGTHVAGTIAAVDNEIGVIGVSPGTTVVSVRVLGANGSGSTSGVIAGIDYVGNPANGQSGDVANMSLTGGFSSALNNAVINASARVKFTLASGNDGDNVANYSPASANGPNIYTVAASDSSDRYAGFSNSGSAVDWVEPGVSILSTYKGGGYATASGTSMAAPHLAGILVQGGVTACGNTTGEPSGTTDRIGCR